MKVWLQVEPASCDVPMLIDLVYQQYGHHSSVIGFGVDDEWYRKDVSRTGKAITDAEAAAWVAQVRTKDPADLVLVKHWLIEKMPPTYRDGLVFVDDSQGHGSLANMVNEFTAWGQAFAPAPVGFQFGYQSRQGVVEHAARSAAEHRQRAARGDHQHARPALGRLHRLRHLARRIGAACDAPAQPSVRARRPRLTSRVAVSVAVCERASAAAASSPRGRISLGVSSRASDAVSSAPTRSIAAVT